MANTINVRVKNPGTEIMSQKLVPVRPMAPPSGKLLFTDPIGTTNEGEGVEIISGNLFIVFLNSLVLGAYFRYNQAKAIKDEDPDNTVILPTWFNTDNYKLSKKLYAYYSDGKSVIVSRSKDKIDFIKTFYKYETILVFNPDTVSYAVESCTNNAAFDILSELPKWVEKYGTPYH